MDQRTVDRLAAAIVAIALAAGLATIVLGRFDSGIRLAMQGEYVVIDEVQQPGVPITYGLVPGMIVAELEGVTLINLPQYVYPAVEPTPDPNTGEYPNFEPLGVEPAKATVVQVDPTTLVRLLSVTPTHLLAIDPSGLEAVVPYSFNTVQFDDDGVEVIRRTFPTYLLGVALLVLLGWWLASGRAGDSLRPLAMSLATASAVPFLVQPLNASWVGALLALGTLLVVAAMLPLAAGLIARIDDEEDRRFAKLAVTACALGAIVIGLLAPEDQPWGGAEGLIGWTLISAIPFIPGLGAARPIRRRADPSLPIASGRLLQSTEYAVIGATPAIALLSNTSPGPYPLVLWFGLILLAGRFTIRPLARLATRAVLQRDLVVAATEAERARVAADIHDDALQELTLLVHRLDAAGDTEGADIARTVSDRLRAICGDLRLPILDDLGVGPALDWLVLRIERLAGGEVRLERAEGTRPPADVELAFFRVAQEALANAVKHGRPPILVRYATTPGGASLSIDDAGPGIEPDAGEGADRAGHFGLLNMQQRAEAIGAILDVRRWPAGGTHVALDWRAH
jgi:signal transduction histidine kinase